MDLKAIAALVAVAEHGTYSAAADALGCSKAHVSQQIKGLEAGYQTQLVQRTTRQVRLTSAGEQFVRQCRSALGQIRSAEELLLDDQTKLSGRIRIASIGGIFGEHYVAPAVLSFMTAYPEVEVELDFSSQLVDLLSESYDIAVRFGSLPDSSLVARLLLQFRSMLVASEGYLARYGMPQHPDELAQHRLICGTNRQWAFRRQQESVIISPAPDLRCGNGHVMLQAAINGSGITYLPEMYVRAALDEQQLQQVMPHWTEARQPCHILYPPGRYRLKRVQRLVAHLLQEIPKRIAKRR